MSVTLVTYRLDLLSHESEAISRGRLVPLKFWPILEEVDLNQNKYRGTHKGSLPTETVHISLISDFKGT